MKVYIAGPLFTSGNLLANIREGIEIGNKVRDLGHYPFIPHVGCFWQMFHPRSEDDWMEYDLHWLGTCDAMIRIPGDSKGADIEVQYCMSKGIPIYTPHEFFKRFQ